MKKIFIALLLVLGSIAGYSQFPNTSPMGAPTTLNNAKGGLIADTGLIVSRRVFPDTTTANFSYLAYYSGAIIQVSGGLLYYRTLTPNKWNLITSQGNPYLKISDTAAMLSPYLQFQAGVKYYDTSGMLSNRLKISDTAYALSNRLKISDTATAYSYYVRKSLYVNTNYPLRGAGALTGNLTLVADTGRAVGQLVTGGDLVSVRDSLQKNIQAAVSGVSSFSMTTANGVSGTVSNPTTTPNLTITLGNITPSSVVVSGNMTATNVYAGNIVKYSDTASMLSTRIKYSDTAFMLSPYLQKQAGVKYYDTSTMLSPYRRTTTKITNSDLANSTISGISLGSNLATLTFDTYLQYSSTSYNGSTAATISTNATPNNVGSTLMARDVSGNVYANLFIGTLSGNSSSSNTTAITDNNSTNATYYPLWVTNSGGGFQSLNTSSSKITFNPSSGSLTTSTFVGALTGNATTASTLQTPRTINGVAFDGSANISISTASANYLNTGYGLTGTAYNGALTQTWTVDTTKIIAQTDTAAYYGVATKTFVRTTGASTYVPLAGSTSSVPITGNLVFSNNPNLYSNATSGGSTIDAGIQLSGATKTVYLLYNNTNAAILNSTGFTLGSTSGTGTGALYAGAITSSSTGLFGSGVGGSTSIALTVNAGSSAIPSLNFTTGASLQGEISAYGGIMYIGTNGNTTALTINSSQVITAAAAFHIPSNSSGNLAAFYFDYAPNTSSRSWRMMNDLVSYGDWHLQISTTQTGSTYSDVFVFNSSLNATMPQGSLTLGSTVGTGVGSFYAGQITGTLMNALGTASNSVAAGPYFSIANSGNSYQMLHQLNASYGEDIWNYNGSWTKIYTLSATGAVTASSFSGSGSGITGLVNSNLSGSAGITNANLANSSITINSTAVSLGGAITITANNPNSLTINNSGSGAASGSTYNGSSALTISYNTVGAQPLATNLTSLAGLSYASTSFVKMTAAGTFALDVNTYLTTGSASSTYFPISAGSGTPMTGDLYVNGNIFFNSSKYIYTNSDQINSYYNSNASATLNINYNGYNNGSTQFRSLNIYNGKNTLFGIFDGTNSSFTLGSTSGTGTGALYAGAGAFSGLLNTTAGNGISAGGNNFAVAPSATRGVLNVNGSTDQFVTLAGNGYLYASSTIMQLLAQTGVNLSLVSGGITALSFNSSQQATFASSVTASSFYNSSDIRLKNITNRYKTDNGFDFVVGSWKSDSTKQKHFWYIAQEVEKVYPFLVNTDGNGMKSVNYTELHTKEIYDLQKEVIELKKELIKLKSKLK